MPTRAPARLALFTLSGFALVLLEGCTFIGAAIGASVPKYDPLAVENAPSIPPGTEVQIQSATPVDDANGERIEGQAGGVEDGKLVVRSDEFPSGVAHIPVAKIRELRTANGNYWSAGLGLGLLVDVGVFVAGALIFNKFEHGSSGAFQGHDAHRAHCFAVRA